MTRRDWRILLLSTAVLVGVVVLTLALRLWPWTPLLGILMLWVVLMLVYRRRRG